MNDEKHARCVRARDACAATASRDGVRADADPMAITAKCGVGV